MLAKFILFGMFGICFQLFITALKKSVLNRSLELTGEASLILFPVYGLIAFIYPVIAIRVGGFPWYVRGIIYMLIIYITQYLVGLGLTQIKLCPWKYTSRWSLHGLVQLSDAPLWFATGLIIDWLYPYVKSATDVIL